MRHGDALSTEYRKGSMQVDGGRFRYLADCGVHLRQFLVKTRSVSFAFIPTFADPDKIALEKLCGKGYNSAISKKRYLYDRFTAAHSPHGAETCPIYRRRI
ncbi:MAG: hypothetical protein IKY59_04255, partial [Oscillospiraceae bacterium]|nr:hypothetical protein [Oscillospiraceae bacterium]